MAQDEMKLWGWMEDDGVNAKRRLSQVIDLRVGGGGRRAHLDFMKVPQYVINEARDFML